MCLLVVAWQHVDGWPLVVGANRDEWLDRPATTLTVLRDRGPRTLGGRDERAGGTWLAVNEHGVVCGLTNRPMPDGPDPTRRSRGRLPLVATAATTADDAVGRVAAEVADGSYNPAWLLIADRDALHSVAVHADGPAEVRRLGPGLHVLENDELGAPSVKVDHVRHVLGDAGRTGTGLWEALPSALADHTVAGGPGAVHRFPDGRERRAATLAACVHSDGYGTRSSALLRVGPPGRVPELLVADGPPCTAPFVDVDDRWSTGTVPVPSPREQGGEPVR